MLQGTKVTVMLPVVDLPRARKFYEESLGLKPAGESPDGKFHYQTGGTLLALFPKPSPTKAEHTAVSFEVPDVDAAVKRLSQQGVTFEDYDFPGLKTVNKVCVLGSEKAAWFKDTEGNLLCIHQPI